jgi:hypothetical protein
MRTTPQMGLTSWDQAGDFYNYAQLAGNWSIVDFHDHSPGKGTPVSAGGLAPGAVLSQSIAAGVVGVQHFNQTLIEDLGLNGGSTTGRGLFIQATAGTTSGTSFGSLNNGPDQVAGIVLATNGLIVVDYMANWSMSGAVTGTADIFLNNVELITPTGATAAATTAVTANATLATNGTALSNIAATTATAATTGVALGTGTVIIYAAAGTYTVSVQFKVASGTLTVSNRRLYVRTVNFA